MTADPEIPADVMAAARRAASFTHDPGFAEVTHAIARAILAERQRCADYVSRRPGAISQRQEIVAGLLRGDVCDVFGKITLGNDI